MTGLMIKDFLVLRKALKSYLLIIGFYAALAALGMFNISFVSAFISVMVMILPISAFAYDEQAGWDRCAMSLPLGRRKVVTARYLFILVTALISCAGGAAVSVLLSIAKAEDVTEMLATILTTVGLGLVVSAILLPLCYKLGAERARPYLYLVVFLPLAAIFLAYRMGVHVDTSALDRMPQGALLALFALIPLGGLALAAVSWLISCRIVEKKEF